MTTANDGVTTANDGRPHTPTCRHHHLPVVLTRPDPSSAIVVITYDHPLPTLCSPQVRQLSHCGFNLPACVFANYNFSAAGAGERARMMYFFDLGGDEDR